MLSSRYLVLAITLAIVTVQGRLDPQTGPADNEEGQWHASWWEPCEPEKIFEEVAIGPVRPTVGIQRRTVTCVSSNATVLAESRCQEAPIRQRRCIVTQRCQVAGWSPWETLQVGCRGDDDQVVVDIAIRRRRVVRAPIGDAGTDADADPPALEERRVVDDAAQLPACHQRYKWQHSPWSTCRPETSGGTETASDADVCGGGVQFRSLTCFRIDGARPVHPQLCRGLAKLPVVQHCEIPCDLDCQVTDWTVWSVCVSEACDGHGSQGDASERGLLAGYRRRERRVVSPASAGGIECPPLEQLQRCRPETVTCYRWEATPIDACRLVDASSATCGAGLQDLAFQCRRYDEVIVDDELCANATLPEPNQRPCRITCPDDCVLSEWSSWTRCTHSDPKRRRWRHVLGHPTSSAAPCPPLSDLFQEEVCPTGTTAMIGTADDSDEYATFSWWPLPWSECDQLSNGRCGRGHRQREVRCMKNDIEHVDAERCRMLTRPDSSRPCDVACPQDCLTSAWSTWSTCGGADALDEAGATQTRMRRVVQAPADGGVACAALVEKRSCLDWLQRRRQRLRWHLGPWSPCRLTAESACGDGIMTRGAFCRDERNRTVEASQCLLQLPLSEFRRLQLWAPCRLPCLGQAPCPVPSASVRTPSCPRNCIGRRQRRRRIPSQPQLLESDDLGCFAEDTADLNDAGDVEDVEECPCQRLTLEAESWSPCLVQDQRSCGPGRQYRRRKCTLSATGQLAPLSWCNEEDYETRDCQVVCPSDCRLSSWSPWTPCNAACGPGIQRRHRNILAEPSNGGRRCGALEEIQPCRSHDCELYKWHYSDWTPCYFDGANQCGTTTQHRTVRCMNVVEEVVVHDGLCDATLRGDTTQTCHVACPGQCVLTSWTPWTICSHCEGSRSRQRSIRRNPIYNETCGALDEVQPCSVEFRNCWTYAWQVSDWGSCIPLGGSQCGEGTQARALSCIRSDGYPVQHSFCDIYTRPVLTEQWCTVECPIDCQLSSWTPWNESECSYDHQSGVRVRQRHVLIDGNVFGRQCPPVLHQRLPCPYRPSYEWRPTNWSHCLLQGAQCGKGIQMQVHECVQLETNLQVDVLFCQLADRPAPSGDAVQRTCHVPCLFELAARMADEFPSVLPSACDDEIRVHYEPNDDEFNIWMVAMISMGSLFLVFVGVTICLICSTKSDQKVIYDEPMPTQQGRTTRWRPSTTTADS